MWITYYIPAYWVVSGMSAGGLSYFSLFLKTLVDGQGNRLWSTTQVNTIPIGGGAVQVVFSPLFPTIRFIIECNANIEHSLGLVHSV